MNGYHLKNIEKDPSMLFQIHRADEISVFGNNIYSPFNDEKITIVSVSMEPQNSVIWESGKMYFDIKGKLIEYTLKDQIRLALENSGWIHAENNSSYRVSKGIVLEIRIFGTMVGIYNKIGKDEFIDTLGEYEFKYVLPDECDDQFSMTIFDYRKKMIRVYTDDFDNNILSVNLGESLVFH